MLRSVLGRRTGLEKSVVINFDDKRKKVTERSPSDDIGVPAEMIDQLTPDSGAPKMANPTVRGLVSTELVMTKGHRKLFQ